MAQKPKPIGVRFDDDELVAAIKRRASEVDRSFNWMVNDLCRVALRVEGVATKRKYGASADTPRELMRTAMPVVGYISAGKGRDPEPIETGETVEIVNPTYRSAKKGKWQVTKVIGESMEREYAAGDFVLIDPKGEPRDGDVCAVMHNGDFMLKVLRFTRGADGKMERPTLVSFNPRYQPIPVYPEDDFHLLGVEAYHVKRGQNYR
ncbi:MAG: S24 family peptidase [Thermoanaerobaculia bacterium]